MSTSREPKRPHPLKQSVVLTEGSETRYEDGDLTLIIGDWKFVVHADSLAHMSPYFKAMINGNWKESREQNADGSGNWELTLEDIEPMAAAILLRLVHGVAAPPLASVSVQLIEDIRGLADYWRMTGVLLLLRDAWFAGENIKDPSAVGKVRLYRQAATKTDHTGGGDPPSYSRDAKALMMAWCTGARRLLWRAWLRLAALGGGADVAPLLSVRFFDAEIGAAWAQLVRGVADRRERLFRNLWLLLNDFYPCVLSLYGRNAAYALRRLFVDYIRLLKPSRLPDQVPAGYGQDELPGTPYHFDARRVEGRPVARMYDPLDGPEGFWSRVEKILAWKAPSVPGDENKPFPGNLVDYVSMLKTQLYFAVDRHFRTNIEELLDEKWLDVEMHDTFRHRLWRYI